MHLAFGILVITLVVMLDSIESAGQGSSREKVLELSSDSDDDGILYPPPPHLRKKPEPVPEFDSFIKYPYPYYYDEHGVIRDYMNTGSEGIVVHNMLVGMRRANGRHDNLLHRGRQYVIELSRREIIFREPGTTPTPIGVGAPHYRRPHPAPNTPLHPGSSLPHPNSGMDHPSFIGRGHPSSSQGHPSSSQGHPSSSQVHSSNSPGHPSNSEGHPSNSHGHSSGSHGQSPTNSGYNHGPN